MACWKARERCIHSSATAADGSASLPGACMPCARSAESTARSVGGTPPLAALCLTSAWRTW
eukprot:scaffold92907_cov63-Phaeocystis_antarctica.AAC.7